ncbi:MAG TPA: AAA family ATPase [Bacteroidia bacterium]
MKVNYDYEGSGIGIEEIKTEKQKLLDKSNEANENKGLFKLKSANSWLEQAKSTPIPKMLFSELWFEGELCILFADTNLGKSILAVQIGNSISKGIAIKGFTSETSKQLILYFDFELSPKQFENRYSLDFKQPYNFDENFIRVEINPDAEIPESQSFEDYLNDSLEQSIISKGAKVLIIDNLTYLKNETERAKDALPLMKHLKALKNKYGLSILALAHTPKRDLSKPLTKNDLQGSKMLINFCDSCFTIGESVTDKNLRYIKQIKQRNTEELYGTDNVITCQIEKPTNFLRFEFLRYSKEYEHLKQLDETAKEDRITKALELKKQGKSNIEVARTLNVSEGAVRKWIIKVNSTESK